jgi:hypothetical protein
MQLTSKSFKKSLNSNQGIIEIFIFALLAFVAVFTTILSNPDTREWFESLLRRPSVTPGPNPTQLPSATPATMEVSHTKCDPQNGTITNNFTNPYLPLPVGMVNVLENADERVRITVLNETKVVNGVTTQIIEEYETATTGELIEISRNYFAQTNDGTVCYFGEDVDIYIGGQVVSHDGTWHAGVGGAKAGIMMPASPKVGMHFMVEDAPGITTSDGTIKAIGETVSTPYGSFADTIYIEENNGSEISVKYYARNIAMIVDDGMKLVSHFVPQGTVTPGPTTSNPTPTTASPTATSAPTPTTASNATATPTPSSGASIHPPAGALPTSEQLMQFSALPSSIQTIVNQAHPTKQVKEVKKETYSNGAIVYAIELIISGSQWDMGILPDGTVIRDEKEIVP